MKVHSSHLVVGVLAVIGVFFVLAFVRPSGGGDDNKTLSETDKFLSQVDRIRESGGGSTAKDGVVPRADVDISQHEPLEFSENPVEMGTIARDKLAEKRVTVKNPSGIPIDVLDISTSCVCTLGRFERSAVRSDGRRVTTIAPGDEEVLLVTVDPKKVHGFYSTKTLSLTTTDPVVSVYGLDVTAHVDPEFAMEPNSLDFGIVQAGEPAEVRAHITQLIDEPFDIRSVQLPLPSAEKGAPPPKQPPVALELVKTPESQWKTPGRAEWDVIARLLPTADTGVLDLSAWFMTNSTRVEDIGFKVVGKVVSFFDVTPPSLGARDVVTPGRTRVAKATINAVAPITVSDPVVTGDDLTLEVVPQPDNPKNVDLYINVSPEATPGLKNETLTFTISGGDKSVQHTMRAFVSIASAPPAPAAQ